MPIKPQIRHRTLNQVSIFHSAHLLALNLASQTLYQVPLSQIRPPRPQIRPLTPQIRKTEKIALCGIIGHWPLWGRCPSHHHISTYTNIGASGTADHVTLLRLNFGLIWVFQSEIGSF